MEKAGNLLPPYESKFASRVVENLLVANHRRGFHMNPGFFCTFPIFLSS